MIKAVAARRVLSDCRLAHQMLEDERDVDRWRVVWVGAVALLRAVGHVLDKVDGSDPKMRAASRAAFARWRSAGNDQIFSEFIDAERNTILKEYGFRTDLQAEVPVEVASVAGTELFSLDQNLFRPMVDGYAAGEDARDVYLEAIKWWQVQLDEIERAASNRGSREPD